MLKTRNILIEWIAWHFYETPKFLFSVWKNYILFALNYFSILILIKSLFSPWRKYTWKYPKIVEFREFLNTLISNFFSRLLGAIMRVFLIIAGILSQVLIVFAGLIVFVLWFLVPIIVLVGILFAFVY